MANDGGARLREVGTWCDSTGEADADADVALAQQITQAATSLGVTAEDQRSEIDRDLWQR